MKAIGLGGPSAAVFFLLAALGLVLLGYLGWLIGQSARGGPEAGSTATPSVAPPVEVAVPDCLRPDGTPVGTPLGLHAVREIELTSGSPVGLVYLPGLRTLGVLDQSEGRAQLHQVTLFGDVVGTNELPVERADALATGATPEADLVALDRLERKMRLVARSPSGAIAAVTGTIDLRSVGISEVTSFDVDSAAQEIVLAEGRSQRIIRIPIRGASRARSVGAEGIAPCAATMEGTDGSAMAIRPSDGHIFMAAADAQVLREHDRVGRLLSERSLMDLGLDEIMGMAFGPTADVFDPADAQHLYVLTTGAERSTIVSLSFDAPPPPSAATPRVAGTIVARIATSEIAPPSSDPTGLAFDRSEGRLIVTDSEIDELPEFAGHTIFEVGPFGGWSGLGELRLSNEITDIAIDADGGRWFFSDDSKKQIIEIGLGPDGEFGTGDDSARVISTVPFGSLDPEGMTFGQGSLFISDGAGAEVYRLAPGPDGVFNGVAPTGDDTVHHFDTSRLGIEDPEGIAFDPDRGTIYVRGRDRREPIVEVATDGTPILIIELDREVVTSAGGIELWPASDGSGTVHLMIADRGADSGRSDVPNDGQLIEIGFDRPPAGG